MLGGRGIQSVQGVVRTGEATDPGEGGVDVRPVVDRSPNAGQGHLCESGCLEDRGRRGRIAQRERVRGIPLGTEDPLDLDRPLVLLLGLPDEHDQPPVRPQRPPDVAERGDGIGEEHRPEPADRQVESTRPERMHLSVTALEREIPHSLVPRRLPRPRNGRRRHVNPEHGTAHGQPGSLPGGPPTPTPDVDHPVPRTDLPRRQEHLVVPPKLSVVVHLRQPPSRLVRGSPAARAVWDRYEHRGQKADRRAGHQPHGRLRLALERLEPAFHRLEARHDATSLARHRDRPANRSRIGEQGAAENRGSGGRSPE